MFGLFQRRPADQKPKAGAGRVSVVVPLYNHASYIGTAIGSVLEQGDVVREIIVIDDGSSDESCRVMQQLARRDARIRFRTQANQGAHATINAGLRDCGGEFIAILNSDDEWLPGRLDRLALLLDAEPQAVLAASGIAFMDGSGASIQNDWYVEALAFHRRAGDLGVALVNANLLMTTSNFLLRRNTLPQIGDFAALRYAHDLDFALRTLALGHRIALSDEVLLRYRLHGSNTISEDHRKVRAEWAACGAAYLTLLWDRQDAPEPDWTMAGAVEDVLRRHELTRAVGPCMAYLRRHGGGRLDNSPLLADETFKAHMLEWV